MSIDNRNDEVRMEDSPNREAADTNPADQDPNHPQSPIDTLDGAQDRTQRSAQPQAQPRSQPTPEQFEEQRLIRRLQMMMNLVMQTIAQDGSLTVDEASQMIADSRKAALAMFPGKELAYDLIWRPRFQRLMRERFRIM
jgi:hypothetical protein